MQDKRRRCTLLGLVVLLGVLSATLAFAAEEQVEKPRFMVLAEEDIIPEKMETYMAARIAGTKLSAEHRFEYPYLTFVHGFRVTTVYLFEAFAQLDGVPQMLEAWNEKTGGKSKQLEKQAMSCVDRVSTWVNVTRPDLSYWPKEPAFVPDFSKPYYISIAVYHIKPDKYEEAEAVAKKAKELDEKRQSPMAYDTVESIFGADSSFFASVSFAQDKAAFTALEKKLEANPDPEMAELVAKNIHVLREIEMKEGTFVPEASYVPAGTFGDN
jgi:hypothetical protein